MKYKGTITDPKDLITKEYAEAIIPQALSYTTTAPTADNPNGIKIVKLTAEPAQRYNGWLYIIVEA